jgi:hypothetical protein
MFGFAYFLALFGKIIVLSALAVAQSKIHPQVWEARHFIPRPLPSLIFTGNTILLLRALMVLCYQVLRAYIACRMAPLIEWYSMTGFTPKYSKLHSALCI